MRTNTLRLALGLSALGCAAWLGIAGAGAQPEADSSSAQFERMQGFATVVINHVNDAMGTELLPVADGGGVEPGIFVTLTLDEVQIFDQPVASLRAGRVADPTIAAECISECPAVLYDAFQRSWLEAAVESTTFAVEVPQRVVVAAHRDLPAATLLQVVYAAAETRPIQPPQLSLLVNNTRGSLRAQSFFLVPPAGIELRQGSAALGLTIKVSPGQYELSAVDRRYAREQRVTTTAALTSLIKDVKKRYPGKETVILVPEGNVTVRDLMRVVSVVQAAFPRIVLSAGQRIRI